MKTFDEGKAEIARLSKYFSTNSSQFSAEGVKEAHVRQLLIDPLFEALGWDVSNRERVAPQYREVVTEPSLDDEGQKRAPDYAFRVGPETKFYAEAKKLKLKIGQDPQWAHQIRRYGWCSKHAVAILTDFEELAIFDCTAEPRPRESASHRQLWFFKCEEYADRWKDIWEIFSREAVWAGRFDEFAASKRKRGTSEVDDKFLKMIELWRDSLAKNIALRNARISSEELNLAVQATIDRIVFLRMAEDRGLEPYQQLLKLCERTGIYSRFVKDICRKADDKYNSGLFHFHAEPGVKERPDLITPKIIVDDSVLKPIIQRLYFEHGSNYDFRMIPVEILGTVYERFLGKVITLTKNHKARIEKKPEVRKSGGVYYTPANVVQRIVEKTIGEQIRGRSPSELSGKKGAKPFRILDMACGSGSFLLGAYRALLDHCLNWYSSNPDDAKNTTYADPLNGELRLNIDEKKRILTTHIFGVDIDPQAVEVSKLSLLLKALEGENNTTLSMQRKLFDTQRALPNLAGNIKCGNSLVGMDFYTSKLSFEQEDVMAIRAFDWAAQFPQVIKAGGFDCIVGNPPYDVVEKDRKKASWPHSALMSYVRVVPEYGHALGRKLNLYRFFLIRALQYLKPGGHFGMIVPLSLLGDISTSKLRRRIFSELINVSCDCFPQKDNKVRRVFRDAKLSTVVIAGVSSKRAVKDPKRLPKN